MSDAGSDADPKEQPPSIGTYEGDRAATGERHGKGRNTFPNGDVYEGDYVNGKREGHGMYTWKKPKGRYLGGYANNKRHGEGAMVYPDGGRYKGTFSEGKRHGKGLYVYPNGDYYEGEWQNDLKHGAGMYMFLETGSQINGTWENNWLQGKAEILHNDHKVIGHFKQVVEKVPINPDDESLGMKDVVIDSAITLPCELHFNSTGYVIPNCMAPEQVGLGVPPPANPDETQVR